MTKRSPSSGFCAAHDITWAKEGAQCLNCGGTGPTGYEVKHLLTPQQREDRYVFGLGNASTRLTTMVDAKGVPIE